MNEIFDRIFACNSMTAIEYIIDDAMPTASPEHKAQLQHILQAGRDLDEIHARAAEAMGNTEAAALYRAARDRRRSSERPMDAQLHSLLQDCPAWDGGLAG